MIHLFAENKNILRWSKYLGLGLLALAVILFLGEEVEHHLSTVEAWIKDFGIWGYFIFITVFILFTSLLIPESLLSAMAGILFGLQWGFVLAIVANLLAAALQYTLARHFFGSVIERMISKNTSLVGISQAVKENEVKMQFLLRFAPFNPATLSYVFSLAGVRFKGFMVACLAFFPHIIAEVYFGYAAKYLVQMKGQDRHDGYMHDIVIFIGLAALVLVFFMISKIVHKVISKKIDIE